MSKHTQGPWHFEHGKYGYTIIGGCPGLQLSHVTGNPTGAPEENKANARLIAAAPELLEAANRLVSGYWAGDADKLVRTLEAAIAKAEGEAAPPEQIYCALCSGLCEDDGNAVPIKDGFVCAACAKAEPGLMQHIGKLPE